MSRFINNSSYGLEALSGKYFWLDRLAVNDYQLFILVWNIFLLVIPWLVVIYVKKLWLETKFRTWSLKIFALTLALIWLLFIPNTAYIISEVRHIVGYCPPDSPNKVCLENAWMIIFFFTYACLGWVSFYFLVSQAANLVKTIGNQFLAKLFIVITIPLISLGMLLGLFNRWNSWEFFISPARIWQTVFYYLFDYYHFINWLIFSLFLYFLYFLGQFLFKKDFYELFKNR